MTILAAIFVPISVGTSFFGMNVHELNNTGPRLWVFFVATAGICLLALGLWLSLQRFLSWRRDFIQKKAEGRAVSDRLGLVGHLVFKGPTGWRLMFGRNLFLSLLTDGRITFRPPNESWDPNRPHIYLRANS